MENTKVREYQQSAWQLLKGTRYIMVLAKRYGVTTQTVRNAFRDSELSKKQLLILQGSALMVKARKEEIERDNRNLNKVVANIKATL